MSSAHDDSSKKVPTWLLERAAQGELAAPQIDELKARLAAEGRSLDAELAALAISNQELHSQVDKGQTMAEIRRRAARSVETSSRRRSFSFWIAPLALAGSLGIGLLVLRPGHGVGPSSHPVGPTAQPRQGGSEPDEQITFKGTEPSVSPRLWVYRHPAAANEQRPERLSDGARAARGDLLQLAYAAGRDGRYGVLLSIDGAGRVTQHLPEPGASAAAVLRSPNEINLPSAYELDDAPGFERFVLITSTQSFPVAAALDAARTLAAQGASARTAPLALSPIFHQTSVLLQKTSKGTP
jgi:hypothetical protein